MKPLHPLLLVACLGLAGCQTGAGPEKSPAAAPPRVHVAPVRRETVVKEVELPADVIAFQQAQVYARVSGYLEKLLVDRGDRVREGQLLATIRLPEGEREVAQSQAVYARGQAELQAAQARVPRARAEQAVALADYQRALAQQSQLNAELFRAQAAVSQAQAEKKLAEANYARLEGISKEDVGLVARQDLDISRTGVEVAAQRLNAAHSSLRAAGESLNAGRAAVLSARSRVDANAQSVQVAQAQLRSQTFQSEADLQAAHKATEMLAYTEIRAPFSGTVVSRQLDPGALVQSSDRSAQTNPRAIVVLAKFDKVRVRMELPQELAAEVEKGHAAEVRVGDRVFKAPVARVSGGLDMAARTMVAEVDVQNPDHYLHPGMYVKVALQVGAHKNVLAVPAQAVVAERSSRYVYVADGGKVRKTAVKTGLENARLVEITSGLKGGEEVVVTNPSRLLDGVPVEVDR